jgi:hypothetical protein
MKPFFSSRISSLNQLMIFCILGVTTFSMPAMANPVRDLQDEVIKRGISPENVNIAVKARFPNSAFPYYEPVDGCSAPGYYFTYSSNRWFKDACDNHDVCYMTPGKSRLTCDVLFREKLFKVCETTSNLECRITAEVYYNAVRKYGEEFYNKAQKKQSDYLKSVYEWLNIPVNTRVFQTNSYINTGISVRPGDRIKIEASERVRFGLFAGSGTPNGIILNPVYNYFPDVPHGRLMARFRQPGMQDLDGWYPIGVGWDELREVKLSSLGILEFLVNDNQPGDNLGAFRIEVTIDSSKK